MKLLIFLLSAIFIFSIHNSFSQQNQAKKQLFFESNYHYGFVTPHYNYLSYFVNEHVKGLQMHVGVQTKGDKKWHAYYNYPKIGIGYHYSTLSNKEIYGNMNALFAFVDRNYLDNSNRFNFGNRISFGVSYINKKFELYTNPYNMAISSHVNVYINYCIETEYKISPLIHLKTGIGVTHLSNGNYKEPNKGLNLITTFISLSYSTNKTTFIKVPPDLSANDSSKHQFVITGSTGWKNISRFNNNTYSVYSVSYDYSYQIGRTSWIGAALINYYDCSLKNELEYENPDYTYKKTDPIRITLHITYEMKMGDLGFVFQPGFYIINKYKHYGDISNRIGLRYYFLNKITASLFIKAHWLAIADVLEFGIGYKL